MSALQVFIEQYKKLPVLVEPGTCSGKVYIVTGANSGLGLETARHLVRGSAAKVILACRNVSAGKQAKADIERTTGRTGVAEEWPLDLASFVSVQAFAKRACTELERVDALIENAGVFLDKFEIVEGNETTMTVNVVSTIFLAILMMPKLMESAKKFGIQPHVVFVVSALGFQMEKELAKSKGRNKLFDGINDAKIANMDDRWAFRFHAGE
jgi:NAD(P)-dependent dehydrogenase (short-subunit alcohol dehydrogenase family)